MSVDRVEQKEVSGRMPTNDTTTGPGPSGKTEEPPTSRAQAQWAKWNLGGRLRHNGRKQHENSVTKMWRKWAVNSKQNHENWNQGTLNESMTERTQTEAPRQTTAGRKWAKWNLGPKKALTERQPRPEARWQKWNLRSEQK